MRMAPHVWTDHFMLGYHDLTEGIDWFKANTGVEPVAGGKHPGRGTQNAMISLSSSVYLEIIAPDPDQVANPFTSILKQIKTKPALITWAAATNDIQGLVSEAKRKKIPCSGIMEGSRHRTDGSILNWKMMYTDTTDTQQFIRSVFPFFIEWQDMRIHPAITSPMGCMLRTFTVHYPAIRRDLGDFLNASLNTSFTQSNEADMELTIQSPEGLVHFTLFK